MLYPVSVAGDLSIDPVQPLPGTAHAPADDPQQGEGDLQLLFVPGTTNLVNSLIERFS